MNDFGLDCLFFYQLQAHFALDKALLLAESLRYNLNKKERFSFFNQLFTWLQNNDVLTEADKSLFVFTAHDKFLNLPFCIFGLLAQKLSQDSSSAFSKIESNINYYSHAFGYHYKLRDHIQTFIRKPIKIIFNGSKQTFFLTPDGDIYFYDYESKYTKLEIGEVKFKDIVNFGSFSGGNIFLLANNGDVYGYGPNRSGELGLMI